MRPEPIKNALNEEGKRLSLLLKEQGMVITEAEKKKINKMTGGLYKMADDIRKGHVSLNTAREFNITARNIQGQYKVLFANEILAQGTERHSQSIGEQKCLPK